LLTTALGLAAQFPAFSTVISNVPGPREQLFWNGAALDGIYPASIVFDGFAMNITLVSYAKSLDFGIVACRRSLPEIQRMIDYLEDALVELEEVAGQRTRKTKKRATKASAPKKSAPKKKATKKRSTRKAARASSSTSPGSKPKSATKLKRKRKVQPRRAAADKSSRS
jgi:diacylglycerol O-acyltransferase / wax synthase